MSLLEDIIMAGIKGINFKPKFYKDTRYKVWFCNFSIFTCKPCFDLHGKLYLPQDAPPDFPNKHKNCACTVVWSESVKKGTCTFEAENGIDVLLLNGESLPKHYLTKKEAKNLGWKPFLMNLHQVTDKGTTGGGIYRNEDGKLPSADGRIWYEADINYTGGIRNSSRILYSNDGLVFVTYDHYFTFNQIG